MTMANNLNIPNIPGMIDISEQVRLAQERYAEWTKTYRYNEIMPDGDEPLPGPLQEVIPSRDASTTPAQVDLDQQQDTSSEVGDIGGLLKKALGSLAAKGAEFQTRMAQMSDKEGGITQEDMLQLQFEMGQYNSLVESVSNVTKSLTDTLKSLAQKVG
jgi:type III secretion protein F